MRGSGMSATRRASEGAAAIDCDGATCHPSRGEQRRRAVAGGPASATRHPGIVRRSATHASAAVLLSVLGLVGCASGGGAPECRVRVIAVEKYANTAQGPDLAYRVGGEAGAPGVVSLVAKLGQGRYITGYGVQVGPGPFEAIVELKLTGPPSELLTMLEVGGQRCTAAAPSP